MENNFEYVLLKELTKSLMNKIDTYIENKDNKSTEKYKYDLVEELNCFISCTKNEFKNYLN